MKTMSKDSRLVFENVCVSMKSKNILHDVNGEAKSGQLLAVMGPTGSGKTTLLNAIAGRVAVTSGHVTLDGRKMTKATRRRVAYVLQNDIFLSQLTLYETLYFAAIIRIPDSVPRSEKLARIDEIVDALQIRGCLHTIIGDYMVRGLSGGEKKRANIACELLTDPDILLIDEPTSGLDSSTAHALMQQLKQYATSYNKTIVATIHQPSSQIYSMFSKLMLLVNGHTAYFGEAGEALTYFGNMELHCQPHYNPADFLLELLTSDESVVDKITAQAAKHDNFRADTVQQDVNGSMVKISQLSKETSNPHIPCLGFTRADSSKCILDIGSVDLRGVDTEEEGSSRTWPTSFWTQYRMLTWRSFKQSKGRIFDRFDTAQALFIALLGGMMYFRISDSLDTFRDRMGVIFFCVVYWGFQMTLVTIAGFPGEREVVMKERRAGAYRLSAYYFAKISSELPLLVVVPIIFYSVIYWMSMIGDVDHFFVFLGVNLLSCLTAQGLGHIIGATIVNIKNAIIAANTVMVGSLALGGFFNTHFPSWLAWARYLSLIHYPFGAMVTTILGNADPIPCNQTSTETFKICETSEFITGKDLLLSVGIELPLHCYLATLGILAIILKIFGYYALKWKES